MDTDIERLGREAVERSRRQRAEWEARPFRPLAWLRCKLTHTGRSEEWESEEHGTSRARWLVGAWCGECDRPLSAQERAGCPVCGR